MNPDFDPLKLIRRKRKIKGMSAILLPFQSNGDIDWTDFQAHVRRTNEWGLTPAVNMDTGYAGLIDEATREQVLSVTQSVLAGDEFVAGAFVSDVSDSNFDLDGYRTQIKKIESHGGMPIVFPSFGLTSQSDEDIIDSYRRIGESCNRFLAFELGKMFAPFGKIFSLEVYRELVRINSCVGAKHSSLRRDLEWERLLIRDELRPEFMVLTGNDLAIDMVMYGSDYLLGLSTFCPDVFAKRDAMWASGNAEFYQLNDWLQYLGFFAFRNPTSAYKHSAAMFLHQRGWISSDLTHPDSPIRPASDRAILFEIGQRFGISMKE